MPASMTFKKQRQAVAFLKKSSAKNFLIFRPDWFIGTNLVGCNARQSMSWSLIV